MGKVKRRRVRKSQKTCVKKGKRGRKKEEHETVVKRNCVNPVSVEALDIFSQGAICDSCGVNSGFESGKWWSVLVSAPFFRGGGGG